MAHQITKVLTLGDLRVELNHDGELVLATKRGVTVTLNDPADLEALLDLVLDAKAAQEPGEDDDGPSRVIFASPNPEAAAE